MNIQNDYSYNVSMNGKGPHFNRPKNGAWDRFKSKIKQKVFDTIPQKTFKDDEERLKKYGQYQNLLARPDVNRVIMGVTAIATQPAIDYYNHRVDDETRTVSRNRTIAKIFAGTAVGYIVRNLCYRTVEKMTDLNGTKKHSKALLPKEWIDKFAKNKDLLNNHKSAIATGIALVVMLFTNFLLDAPLTVYFTNRLNAKSAAKKKRKEAING